MAADVLQERGRARRVEVADVRAEEQQQRPAVQLTRQLVQRSFVRGDMRADPRVGEHVQRPRRGFERADRQVHQVDVDLLRRTGLEHQPQLFAVAGPELDDRAERLQPRVQLGGM